MGLFKKIFKKKPGGTFVGNLLRGAASAASALDVPGAGFATKLLGAAPSKVQNVATQALSTAISSFAQTPAQATLAAANAATSVLDAGGTQAQAQNVAQAVEVAAQQSPTMASLTFGDDVKTVLKGALEGAKEGAVNDWLDKTDAGQQAKKAAVDAQGTKMMPYILIALLGVVLFPKIKKLF